MAEKDIIAVDKEKSLLLAIQQIEKEFGKGTIMRLGADAAVSDVPVISTGSMSLDIALGIYGLPKGRIVEIFGPESSGKTTLCLHVIANAQAAGGNAAIIDVEHALDPVYAQKIGVDVDKLVVSQPDCGEDALNIADTLIRSNSLDVLVVDSVAALVPRAEIEGQMGDSHVGLQARLMSQALRKLTGAASKSKTCVIFTNQIREKIGVMYGNPETTPGGNALKFYASIRMDIRKSTCWAAMMMYLLLGRTKTTSAGTLLTSSRISWVLGFMVWPPETVRSTPRLANTSAMPSPATGRGSKSSKTKWRRRSKSLNLTSCITKASAKPVPFSMSLLIWASWKNAVRGSALTANSSVRAEIRPKPFWPAIRNCSRKSMPGSKKKSPPKKLPLLPAKPKLRMPQPLRKIEIGHP